jgi:hypothetical protein
VADHPLRPAIDHRLGRQLPHQLANRTQAPPQATSLPLALRLHAVLAPVSQSYPPPMDRFLRDTHPSATTAETVVRLACVKHAASVRSEPGSNSQVHPSQATKMTQLKQTDPKPNQLIPTSLAKLSPSPKAKRRKCTDQWNTLSENIRLAHKLRYTDKRPQTASSQSSLKTNPQTNLAQHHITYVSQRKLHKGAANISLPIPDSTFKEQSTQEPQARRSRGT